VWAGDSFYADQNGPTWPNIWNRVVEGGEDLGDWDGGDKEGAGKEAHLLHDQDAPTGLNMESPRKVEASI